MQTNSPSGAKGTAGSTGSGKSNICSISRLSVPFASFFALCLSKKSHISSSPLISSSPIGVPYRDDDVDRLPNSEGTGECEWLNEGLVTDFDSRAGIESLALRRRELFEDGKPSCKLTCLCADDVWLDGTSEDFNRDRIAEVTVEALELFGKRGGTDA